MDIHEISGNGFSRERGVPMTDDGNDGMTGHLRTSTAEADLVNEGRSNGQSPTILPPSLAGDAMPNGAVCNPPITSPIPHGPGMAEDRSGGMMEAPESPIAAAPRRSVLDDDPTGLGPDLRTELFQDQYGAPWVRVWRGDHFENLKLRGKAFRNLLILAMVQAGERPSRGRIDERLVLFEALASRDSRPVENRSAWVEEGRSLCIDLADSSWRAATVTPSGWTIERDPPVRFGRHGHQKPLPEPDPSGDLRELLRFLPLEKPCDQLQVLTFAVTAHMPFPRPILMVVGPQGSAKTTLCALVRRLLDPSHVEILGRDARSDRVLSMYRHAVPLIDNASTLTPDEADLYCQVTTGRATDRRVLFTDDGEFILSLQRPLLMNGTLLPTNRPDLLDRCMIIDLDRLSPDRRRALGRLDAEFREAYPRLFGGLLNAQARTLALLPTVADGGLARMADFHLYGRAAAEALGFGAAAFDAAMKEAEARQRRDAADNALPAAIVRFIRKQLHWEGTTEDLLDRLVETARAHHIRRSAENWPGTPDSLGKRLKQLTPELAEHGVTVTSRRTARKRLTRLEYDPAADHDNAAGD